jgi:hypothetical protein
VEIRSSNDYTKGDRKHTKNVRVKLLTAQILPNDDEVQARRQLARCRERHGLSGAAVLRVLAVGRHDAGDP